MARDFKENLIEKDWAGPSVEVLHAAFLLLLDALQIFTLFAIATGLDLLLEHLHISPIRISVYSINATEIIKNFDYMLLIMFLIALIWRFMKILVNSR